MRHVLGPALRASMIITLPQLLPVAPSALKAVRTQKIWVMPSLTVGLLQRFYCVGAYVKQPIASTTSRKHYCARPHYGARGPLRYTDAGWAGRTRHQGRKPCERRFMSHERSLPRRGGRKAFP